MPHFNTGGYIDYRTGLKSVGNSSDTVLNGISKANDEFVFVRSAESSAGESNSSDDEILLIEASSIGRRSSFDEPTAGAEDSGGGTEIPDCIIWNIDGAEATLTF